MFLNLWWKTFQKTRIEVTSRLPCICHLTSNRLLRERTVVEAAARKEQFVAINSKCEEEYAAMNSVRDVEDASLRERCVDLKSQIKVQNADREAAQVDLQLGINRVALRDQ